MCGRHVVVALRVCVANVYGVDAYLRYGEVWGPLRMQLCDMCLRVLCAEAAVRASLAAAWPGLSVTVYGGCW